MLLFAVPLALFLVVSLLALASRLERRQPQVLIRLALRSKAGPDTCENVIARELAELFPPKSSPA